MIIAQGAIRLPVEALSHDRGVVQLCPLMDGHATMVSAPGPIPEGNQPANGKCASGAMTRDQEAYETGIPPPETTAMSVVPSNAASTGKRTEHDCDTAITKASGQTACNHRPDKDQAGRLYTLDVKSQQQTDVNT
ncbi:hypothetical protein V5O48_018077 [Marasmius crinis-equi]|uniref:Uncharacterized protein n=1 Tax=Marasmius crinis-equi TaxID=585013 RepID=A0ABR3EMC3_9AGAR